jgi:hypothetical protein
LNRSQEFFYGDLFYGTTRQILSTLKSGTEGAPLKSC